MKQILLFGAGKSSTALINYFLVYARAENWHLVVADANEAAIREKTGNSIHSTAVPMDIYDEAKRRSLVQHAEIVISLLPPALHILVAKDCLLLKKNLLTASYVDEQINALKHEIEKEGLLFLYEMGLDPGIDHMSAKKLIDSIHAEGGKITSFLSHCGGLTAPESDNNPWHYKISWNPRNVVLAGKAGALFKEEGLVKNLEYKSLFDTKRYVAVPGFAAMCWYPNRDSLSYIPKYELEEAETFIRTTLRHPDFIYGWKNLVELNLTDETIFYKTDGKSLSQFFQEHMAQQSFDEWLEKKLHEQVDATQSLLSGVVTLEMLKEEAAKKNDAPGNERALADGQGDLQNIAGKNLKSRVAATLANQMHNTGLTLKQLFFLGMEDEKTLINKGRCSAADVLQFALEKKLMLQPADKDMVVMLHEIEYTIGPQRQKVTSTLLCKGEDATHTAMAKTVGLPLAIAAKRILHGLLTSKGLHIPVSREIYAPLLKELGKNGIQFHEETTTFP